MKTTSNVMKKFFALLLVGVFTFGMPLTPMAPGSAYATPFECPPGYCWNPDTEFCDIATGEGCETGGSPCNYKLGHSDVWIEGGEFKANTVSLGSFVVGTGHTVTVLGKIFKVGSQYAVGSTVTMTATDYLCKKCFFGTWWCGDCNTKDDNRNIMPCVG